MNNLVICKETSNVRFHDKRVFMDIALCVNTWMIGFVKLNITTPRPDMPFMVALGNNALLLQPVSHCCRVYTSVFHYLRHSCSVIKQLLGAFHINEQLLFWWVSWNLEPLQ